MSERTTYRDRLSGEEVDAANLSDAIEHLRDALTPGETVRYELDGSDGSYHEGEITG